MRRVTMAAVLVDPAEHAGRVGVGRDAIEGHEMAKRGRAGPTLGTAAIGSFVAGTIGILLLTFLAEPVGRSLIRGMLSLFIGLFTFGAMPTRGAVIPTFCPSFDLQPGPPAVLARARPRVGAHHVCIAPERGVASARPRKRSSTLK